MPYAFVLVVVSGCADGYDGPGERVRCVFMGGRDLEPSRTHREQKFDLSEDSISAFRFLCVPQWPMPISKHKGTPPFSRTKSVLYGDLLSLHNALSSKTSYLTLAAVAVILS